MPSPGSSSSSAPSSDRPVFARKTSSSEGWWTWSVSIRMCSASSARTTAARSPSADASRTAPPFDEGDGSPKRPRIARSALELGGIGGDRLERRAPDLGLQRGRRSLGDDVAVVDDPDAVGEHVRLFEVLGREEDRDAVVPRQPRDLLPERAPALRVEPGRRLVEEEDARAGGPARARGRAGASCRPSSPHLAVGGVRQPDALEQLVGARAARSSRGSPCSAACSRRCSRPVSSGSSAASCSAAPIVARTCGPSLDDVVAGDPRRAGGRRQQRRQHQHRCRLARAVRAEEAVDLAGLDRAGRCRRRRAAPS